MRLKRLAIGAMAVAGAAWIATPGVGLARDSEIPRYQHIVEIMMENQSYGTIIGNPLAPQINTLASQYGLATNYYGVTHPSEPNYMANIAGSYFGVQDDNQFYCTPALASQPATWQCGGTTVDHTVSAKTIADQLTAAHKTWKGYFQSLPVLVGPVVTLGPNANGPYTFKYPSAANALYASKHNPFVNFTGTQGVLANMVPDTQLATDLAAGHLANYSLIVPNQCYDMHGTGGCGTTSLIALGDSYVGATVKSIMSSKTWKHGNLAIVITWDEDDFSDQGQLGTGCCGANPGGGHVVTIVIRNHSDDGESHVVDNTAYNHYSLLRTMEAAFGLKCLAHACDSVVPKMTPLFGED
jgi:phosphatidylinositol-3-phosphatase